MNPPNLFAFATSELSQDAFICWLLAWADPKYKKLEPDLHKLAQAFIHSLLNKHLKAQTQHLDLINVEVKKQFHNIDVLCMLNNKFVLLIEDKISSSEHSGQLEKYLKKLKASVPDKIILPIYLKTEEQSDFSGVIKAAYKPYSRADFLAVLRLYQGTNAILLDFRTHLENLDARVKSYLTLSTKENLWHGHSWQGFYQALQAELNGNWGYVANPSGGFWGFWWGAHKEDHGETYLQLEQNKLCIKISTPDKSNARELMYFWSTEFLRRAASSELAFKKPARLRAGYTMSVAVLENPLIPKQGRLDFQATLGRLKQAEQLLNSKLH